MSYSKYYNPTNWENYPSEDTAINAMHLNNLEDGVDTLDDRIVALSTDKSEVSWNQTLISGEKIAEITVNGITKEVYAPEISDSVVEQAAEQALKSEGYAVGTQGDIPVTSGLYYHNNAKYYSEQASDSASDASASAVEAGQSADGAAEEALVSEGWANGEQNGVPVPSTSPYYHNNSKYWSEQSNPTRFSNLSDVNFGTLEDGDIPVYDATSQKWKNEVGVSADLKSNTTGQFNTRTGGLMESCVINLELIQSGSGTPSPDNVRPITGHSSVDIRVIDKDLLTHTATTQTLNGLTFTVSGTKITVNGTATAQTYIEIGSTGDLPQGDYWYSGLPSDASNNTYFITRSASSNNTASDRIWNTSGVQSPRIYVKNGVTCDNVVFDIAISKAYEKTTTSLGQTVYGGELDVASGVLTIDKVGEELSDLSWSTRNTGTNNKLLSTSVSYLFDKTNFDFITEKYKYIEPVGGISQFGPPDDEQIGIYPITTSSSKTIYIVTFVSDTISGKVVYKLAEPLTIQLTPQQIETLIGQNNVSVPLDGQSLDSLTYREVLAWDDVDDTFANKEYNKDYLKSKNLINQDGKNTNNGYVHDAYINNLGSVMSASGTYDVLEYVEVKPSTTYTISGINGNTANGFAEYDSDKTMIAHDVISSSASKTFTTTSNTKYVRFNRNYSNEFFVQLEEGSDATAYTPYVYSNVDLDALKADKSSIGTDESGRTTASRSYAQGEHFYKDGKFCTAKTAIASGATLTLNTNYVEGTIADAVRCEEKTASVPSTHQNKIGINRQTIIRQGKMVSVAMAFWVSGMSTTGTIFDLPFTNNGTAKFFMMYDATTLSPSSLGIYVASDNTTVRCESIIPDGTYWLEGTYVCK